VRRGVAHAPVAPDLLLDALAGTVLMRISTRGRRGLDGLEDELTLLLLRATGARPVKQRAGRRTGTRERPAP
jgi:hypothetical protein